MYYNGYMKSLRKNCDDNWDTHGADAIPANVIGMENCIYTQNLGANGKTRQINNNIFLNNYKSGIAIWSAEKKPKADYLSNYSVSGNIFVNNAGPIRGETPNMLISSDTRNTYNFARNIDVVNNIFYLNTSNDISGISIVRNHNVWIRNNTFYNGTAAVELSGTNRKVNFNDNLYIGKRVKISANPTEFNGSGKSRNQWKMARNRYYTTNPTNLFLTPKHGGVSMDDFQKIYKTETNSKVLSGNPPVQKTISRNAYNPNRFHVVYYNKVETAGNVDFDFSAYGIPDATPFTIRDAEDYSNPVAKGRFNESSGLISFPIIANPGFELPRPSAASGKTSYVTKPLHSNLNFRIFIIEFESKTPAH